jgi:hypothetical protein
MQDAWSENEFLAALNTLIRRHGSQSAAARALGVSTSQLNSTLHGKRMPGKKLATAMGRRQVPAFVPIPPLEDNHGAAGLVEHLGQAAATAA